MFLLRYKQGGETAASFRTTALELCPFLLAGQGLSAAFGIQAAVGKWQGCDVKGSGKFFQRMLCRGTELV